MRWQAKNPSGTLAYYQEPYTVQHFTDFLRDQCKLWFWEMPVALLWELPRHLLSKKHRMRQAQLYNDALFGIIPTSQIYVTDGDQVRPLRPEERTWPETRKRLYEASSPCDKELDQRMRARYGDSVVSVEQLAYGNVRVEYADGEVLELPQDLE